MRFGNWFWGLVLVLLGGLFLVGNLGIVRINVWQLLWPLLLIALGGFILLGRTYGARSWRTDHVTIPLEGAGQARVRIRYGAGRLQLRGGSPPGSLMSGSFTGGLDHRITRQGDGADLELSVPIQVGPFFAPFWGGRGFEWGVQLSDQIPIQLDVGSGACDSLLDLKDLRVTDLRVSTGASATEVIMPANPGQMRAKFESGAASVVIRVPEGVAARIRFEGGLAGITVDHARFPKGQGVYESADFATAANRIEIKVEMGVGSVDIR